MSFKNANINAEHSTEITIAAVQWRRGDLKNQDERLKNGCWQFPASQFSAIVGDAWPVIEVEHSGDVLVESYLSAQLHVATIAYQKAWYTVEDNRLNYLAPGQYVPGAKSKFRIYGLLKELYELGHDEPVVVTTAGLNAKSLEESLLMHRNSVVALAQRIAKKKFPLYAFWLPLASAGKQETRNSQYVTPPAIQVRQPDEKTLESLFVGDEVLELAASFWDDGQDWRNVGQRAGQNGDDDNGLPEFNQDTQQLPGFVKYDKNTGQYGGASTHAEPSPEPVLVTPAS